MASKPEDRLSRLFDVVDGSRIQREGDGAVYLVEEHLTPLGRSLTRRHIPNPATYNNLFRNWDRILVLSSSEFATTFHGVDIPNGAVLVKSDDGSPSTFLLDYGGKRAIPNSSIFDAYWFDPGRVVTVSALILKIIPDSNPVGS